MTRTIDRREFVKSAAATTVSLGVASGLARGSEGRSSPSDRVAVAVMGTNSRGAALARVFARQRDARVAFICDVEDGARAKGVEAAREAQGETPDGVVDFRTVLDDPDVDALVVAAPDHWHTPAAILALQAGKHVYLEKPAFHNPREGELLVEAARKSGRTVQVGTQRRSRPRTIEAIQRLHEGVIGRAYFARGWYANHRGSIGHGKVVQVPPGLDFELWQGPAPRRPYKDNLVHYNWHWFWHWGTAETCNNGTHTIDLMRWGLGVDYPTRVSSTGGRYHYDDDWEMPDSQVLGFDFEDRKSLYWEGHSCSGGLVEDEGSGAVFYGENGSLKIAADGYVVYDRESRVVDEVSEDIKEHPLDLSGPGEAVDAFHVRNFLECLRSGKTPSADVAVHHPSTLMPLLGNIAYRVQRDLRCDPRTGRVLDDPEAEALWAREYEPGWEPKV
jgi:predicted dehydrogenase